MSFDFSTPPEKNFEIECPYCFKKFDHKKVIFRAKGGVGDKQAPKLPQTGKPSFQNKNPFGGGLADLMAETTPDPMDEESSGSTKEDLKDLFRKFDPPASNKANAKKDDELIEYWEGRGAENGYMKDDPDWDLPHIDPSSPDFSKMVLPVDGPQSPFLTDVDGFVYRVVDSYTKNTDPGMTRLCPHCHNPLPGYDYGKYPVLFIAVVGLTSSGKTVFIRQMLNTLEMALETTQYILSSHMIHTLGDEISPTVPLPGSTDTTVMRRPISVTICNREDTSDGITLVFYDIAGENCKIRGQENNDKKTEQLTKKISEFLAHADGMFLLMDPEHLNIFDGRSADANQRRIRDVLNIILTHRTAEGMSVSWKGVPVAVCVTKSDRIADRMQELPLAEPSDPHADGFDNGGGNLLIHEKLKSMLDGTLLGASFRAFDECAYFAVSAISCDVETRIEKYSNFYSLSREDADLFQKTRRWYMGEQGGVKGWNELSEEDRQHRGGFPIRDRDLKLITFPFDTPVTKDNAQMETEIVATCAYDEIHLTLWDVLKNLHPVGYPISEPHPWRIHEPLKWILWRAGYIGPEFRPEPIEEPTLLERTPFGRRKYEEYRANIERDNQIAEAKFYWGKPRRRRR